VRPSREFARGQKFDEFRLTGKFGILSSETRPSLERLRTNRTATFYKIPEHRQFFPGNRHFSFWHIFFRIRHGWKRKQVGHPRGEETESFNQQKRPLQRLSSDNGGCIMCFNIRGSHLKLQNFSWLNLVELRRSKADKLWFKPGNQFRLYFRNNPRTVPKSA